MSQVIAMSSAYTVHKTTVHDAKQRLGEKNHVLIYVSIYVSNICVNIPMTKNSNKKHYVKNNNE